jgi:glycosyltransferase involved in cell wall biosynthesis
MRTRLIFYLSYSVNAALAGLIRARGRYDVLYATSPPLFVGGTALALSRLRRIPLVFEVRDLWPESAIALGELKSPRFIRWSTWLEESCYRRARRIVVVTEGIRQRLIERGIPEEKLALIPNGANTDLFRPDPEAGLALRQELGMGASFLVIYAGIHGVAQRLETVLEAADRLSQDPRIKFLFVGDGPCKADLLRLKEERRIENVTMLDSQPRKAIPAFLSAADVALVPLRRLELFKSAVPSKLFDAWACGCPVLLGIDGEARKVMERAQAGLCVEPESAEALVDAIRICADDPERCRRFGASGRRFVEQYYSRQAQARRMVALLEELQSKGNKRP